jgi:hypothetical protein
MNPTPTHKIHAFEIKLVAPGVPQLYYVYAEDADAAEVLFRQVMKFDTVVCIRQLSDDDIETLNKEALSGRTGRDS